MSGTRPRGGPWAAVGVLAALAVAAGTASAATTSSASVGLPTSSISGRPPTSPTPASAAGGGSSSADRVWAGNGDLAVVTEGRLVVLRDDGTSLAVSGPPAGGFDSTPAWSADGRWLAFLHQPPAVGFAAPAPTLWLVAAGASVARRVPAAGVGVYAWSPTTDVLAYTTVDPSTGVGTADNLWTDVPGRPPVAVGAVAPDATVGTLAWSPGGRDLAVDELSPVPFTSPGLRTDQLAVVPAAGGRAAVVYQQTDTGIDVAGWWPDGRGLLFWVDTEFSASLSADGLPLDSVPVGGGSPTTLATTLVGSQWLAAEPDAAADRVAVVAGDGRYVWMGGRHVEVCRLPAATCAGVSRPAGTLSLAPAWAAAGALLSVDASASPPFGSFGGSLGPASMAAWDATGRLARSVAPAWTGITQRAAGSGVVLAVPARSGTGVLLVRDDAVWLWHLGRRTPPVRIAGPLAEPDEPSGYYGEFDWATTVAWSRAGGTRGGRVDPGVVTAGDVP